MKEYSIARLFYIMDTSVNPIDIENAAIELAKLDSLSQTDKIVQQKTIKTLCFLLARKNANQTT